MVQSAKIESLLGEKQEQRESKSNRKLQFSAEENEPPESNNEKQSKLTIIAVILEPTLTTTIGFGRAATKTTIADAAGTAMIKDVTRASTSGRCLSP